MMEMDAYQEKAGVTSIYESSVEFILQERSVQEIRKLLYFEYVANKLCGEAGEVSEEFAKIIRDDLGILTPERKEKIIKELGDVLWYVARIAHELGVPLEVVAYENLKKLRDRQERGLISGSGSDR